MMVTYSAIIFQFLCGMFDHFRRHASMIHWKASSAPFIPSTMQSWTWKKHPLLFTRNLESRTLECRVIIIANWIMNCRLLTISIIIVITRHFNLNFLPKYIQGMDGCFSTAQDRQPTFDQPNWPGLGWAGHWPSGQRLELGAGGPLFKSRDYRLSDCSPNGVNWLGVRHCA